MPRHLDTALDQMLELDPAIGPGHFALEAAPAALVAYHKCWSYWHTLGFELTVAQRRRVRAMWSEAHHLRGVLGSLIGSYPCDEFEGPFYDEAVRVLSGDFVAWFAWAPRLMGMLRPAVIERARKFNQINLALSAGLKWARYFEGGDDAYRAIALAFNRHDRVYRKTCTPTTSEDFLRHDLNDHGTVTPYEAEQINRHLVELDCELLDMQWISAPGWWKSSPPDYWRSPPGVRSVFHHIDAAVRGFAGAAWSSDDEAIYDAALFRLGVKPPIRAPATTGV